MRRLIVNADDFGMAEPVNLGIIKGHRDGIITSTSLLACGKWAEHAAGLAKENPGLGVGVHLCLTIEKPLLDPSKLPSLAPGGMLPSSPFQFMRRFAFGLIDKTEVEAELRAQVARTLELGVRPTHVDGHQHMHMMPGVLPIVIRIAIESGIKAIRFPVGPWVGRTGLSGAMEKVVLEGISTVQERCTGLSGLKRANNFFGLAQTGRLDSGSLRDIITQLPDGVSEVMCHPGLRDDALAERLGWGMGWETELKAVTDESVIRAVRDNQVELVNYSRLD